MTEAEFQITVLNKLEHILTLLGTENQPGLVHEVKNLGHRVNKLEKAQERERGFLAAVGMLGGLVGALLMKALSFLIFK